MSLQFRRDFDRKLWFVFQEYGSEFDSSMIDDPGTPECIPDVEEKKVNLSSAVMVQGKENDIIFWRFENIYIIGPMKVEGIYFPS